MHQQLRLDAVDPRRLLQGRDHVGEQAMFQLVMPVPSVAAAAPVGYEQVPDHSLAALVDEEGVSLDVAVLHCGIAREDLGVHVAQDHLRRAAVVPGQQARPYLGLGVQQRTQVGGGEMPEVEDLYAGHAVGWRQDRGPGRFPAKTPV
jgi:hypothetical protein